MYRMVDNNVILILYCLTVTTAKFMVTTKPNLWKKGYWLTTFYNGL